MIKGLSLEKMKVAGRTRCATANRNKKFACDHCVILLDNYGDENA